MKTHRPKLKDVAQVAGVSTATVSRVLSNPEVVSAETRQAVAAAIKATGYRMNEAARNLRHQRTGAIVALVPNLANPFFAPIFSGIASVLGPAGYNLLIADTQSSDRERLFGYAEPSRADGLIVLDGSVPAEMLSGTVPVVEACEWVAGLDLPRVKIDNRAAAKLAIEHLAGLGHRRIGYVAGPAENVLNVARLAGVRESMAELSLPLDDSAIYPGDFSLDSGKAAAKLWLAQPSETRPTALFSASDAMACGLIAEVQRHGISVPRDLSVVGFDDIELTAHISPPLTTVYQPRAEIGREAAQRMLRLLAGGSEGQGDSVLDVRLIVRGSTAPI